MKNKLLKINLIDRDFLKILSNTKPKNILSSPYRNVSSQKQNNKKIFETKRSQYIIIYSYSFAKL